MERECEIAVEALENAQLYSRPDEFQVPGWLEGTGISVNWSVNETSCYYTAAWMSTRHLGDCLQHPDKHCP